MVSRQEWSGKNLDAIPTPLREILRRNSRLAIAFSGGLDSRFLCHAARLLGLEVLAIHAAGPHIAPSESQYAREWAENNKIAFAQIWSDPLTLPEVAANGLSRCYECKKSLLRLVREAARDFGGVLCEGGNADDLKEYRPGMRAVREAGVLSPLAMAGMGKGEIRAAARDSGMERPDQKARPCLLTRCAYGLRPDAETLRRLAETELALERELGDADFRLRLKPEPELQIEGAFEGKVGLLARILAEGGFGGAAIKAVERAGGYYDRDG